MLMKKITVDIRKINICFEKIYIVLDIIKIRAIIIVVN